MKLKQQILFISVLVLFGCSPTYTLQSYEDKSIGIKIEEDSAILAIIEPYKNKIEAQMNEVLTYTKSDLKKGKPESTIGNFVTDLCLNYAVADVCVMNNGGLRTKIDEGKITKGKIYELMPFENELVVLELEEKDFIGLLKYIAIRGGEPFSGINIIINNNGEVLDYSKVVDFKNGEKIKILTSDYLADGGDKMWFFKDKKQQKVHIKIRDAIIDYCSKNDTIDVKLDGRIKILNNE